MKTALITGGSSGLGLTLSEKLAAEGYRILWVSKLPDEIEASREKLLLVYPSLQLDALTLDLNEGKAHEKVCEWLDKNGYQVDILVNNAGFGSYGFLLETDLDRELGMMNLHMQVVYVFTRIFLKRMEKRQKGLIINISSNSSFQPTPLFSTYAATKSFVLSFTRAINEEQKMRRGKVRLMAVCPAALNDTPFQGRAKMEKVNTFHGIAATSREEVAGDIMKGIKKGKELVVSGWKMRSLYRFNGLLPHSFKMWLVRREVIETQT
ncbi:MAG: SDR family NAD(P)-dependent oxidoreductase [Bacteroidia bacterium]|nr:SDR family NAD(P)-dependent oxidoreductase [Bacteroidia bacterium]